MCIIFEIFIFLNFDFAAFLFTRFWIAGLFKEQNSRLIYKEASLAKEVEAKVCTRSLAWATNT
jgi:hypothetical protein